MNPYFVAGIVTSAGLPIVDGIGLLQSCLPGLFVHLKQTEFFQQRRSCAHVWYRARIYIHSREHIRENWSWQDKVHLPCQNERRNRSFQVSVLSALRKQHWGPGVQPPRQVQSLRIENLPCMTGLTGDCLKLSKSRESKHICKNNSL